MEFNSFGFLLFVVLVFIFYWVLKKQTYHQNLLILIASYLFYSFWDWRFLSLIFISSISDFLIGQSISKTNKKSKQKFLISISLLINLGLLGFFKYYNFFIDSLVELLGLYDSYSTLHVVLPVGISFYTFQTLSYTIDVYRGRVQPTKNLIAFLAFVSFFPQLVAGPIERAESLLPQFLMKRKFDISNATHGISLITYGLFKKLVIADRLAIYVDSAYDNINYLNSPSLMLACLFFSFQIYCDFSGYSLIARGVAKLFGFELMINFKKPYLASSIKDFWRTWHISLSTWFRDYLYIPLGGNKHKFLRQNINIFIVFLLSGLWHGANWTFVIWGALHGFFMTINGLLLKFKKFNFNNKILKLFNMLIIFSLVSFLWIFFRSNDLEMAFSYCSKLFEFDFNFNLNILSVFKGPFNLILSVILIFILLLSYLLPDDLKFKNMRNSLYFNVLSTLLILFLGISSEKEFIYFQF